MHNQFSSINGGSIEMLAPTVVVPCLLNIPVRQQPKQCCFIIHDYMLQWYINYFIRINTRIFFSLFFEAC